MIEQSNCVVCGKEYKKRVLNSSYRRTTKAIRSRTSKTCSKKCSLEYNTRIRNKKK